MRSKMTRAPCRRRTGEAPHRAEKFGDLITKSLMRDVPLFTFKSFTQTGGTQKKEGEPSRPGHTRPETVTKLEK